MSGCNKCSACLEIGGLPYKYENENGREFVYGPDGARVTDGSIVLSARTKFESDDIIDCLVYESAVSNANAVVEDLLPQLIAAGVATNPDDPAALDVPVVAMLQPDGTITYINMNTAAPYTMAAPNEFRKDTQAIVSEELGCINDASGDFVREADRVTIRDEDGDLSSRVIADPITGLALTLAAGETWGRCTEDAQEYQIYVVRLAGDQTGASTARLQGDGFATADVGNTFTLGGAGSHPEYQDYWTNWLGDTEQDAVLDWNTIEYLAGDGAGSARYTHNQLPFLTVSDRHETHKSSIVLTAQPGAYVEFTFKVKQ